MTFKSRRLTTMLRQLPDFEFVRFLFVGALNTATGYAVYLVGLLAASLSPGVALALATMFGALFNFFTTGRMVFRDNAIKRLPLFLLSYAVVYLANLIALEALIGFGVPASWAQAILLPIMATASYFVFKGLVFRKARPPSE